MTYSMEYICRLTLCNVYILLGNKHKTNKHTYDEDIFIIYLIKSMGGMYTTLICTFKYIRKYKHFFA